jgi:hypothetical protein
MTRFTLVVVALAIVGCAKAAPTAPAPAAAATAVSLSITAPSGPVVSGASFVLATSATLSDGTTQSAVTGKWSVNNPEIASVDASGRVTTTGFGRAIVTLEYLGATTSASVTVLPNMAGEWTGTYLVTECTGGVTFFGDGANANGCDNGNLSLGHRDALTINTTQAAAALSGVSTVRLSASAIDNISFTATIDETGILRFVAATSQPDVRFFDADLTLSTARRILGRLRYERPAAWPRTARSGWLSNVDLTRR